MDNLNLVDYSRQAQLDTNLSRGRYRNETHIIIGCGGVGFWLGLFLAMMGSERMVLIDGDKIEPTNLNRLPVPQTWLGKNKAVSLARLIRTIRPAIVCQQMKEHLTVDNLALLDSFCRLGMGGGVMIWDTTDNAKIQTKIYNTVKELKKNYGVRYNKIGYEAFEVGSYNEYDIWFDDDNYEAGYRTTMANAITSAMAAGLGVFNQYTDRGLQPVNKRDFQVDILKLISEGGNKKKEEADGKAKDKKKKKATATTSGSGTATSGNGGVRFTTI